MRKKYRYTKPHSYILIMFSVAILFLICAAVVFPGLESKMKILKNKYHTEDDKYAIRIKESLNNDEQVILSDVFDFDFAYAYVFNESIKGEKLVAKYQLDIAINDVPETKTDIIRRIIFVNENKELVLNWEYNVNSVFILLDGYYVTPDTVITKERMNEDKVCIKFEGVTEQNYFAVYPEKAQQDFNESTKDLSLNDIKEQNAEIESTQFRYGDYNFFISPEVQEKNQFLYRTDHQGKGSVLMLYSENGITSISSGPDKNTIIVYVNVIVNGVLTNVPVNLNVTQYNRDLIWVENRLS